MSTLKKSSENICEFVFFRLWTIIFCYLGVFAQNVAFIKKNPFCERIFWEQSWLEQTPPTGFLDLFLIFKIFVLHICIYLGNLGVEGAMCKILELYDQNLWRYYFSNNALWGRCKMGSKVANFDWLFFHGFLSLSSKILHIAPSTPKKPK